MDLKDLKPMGEVLSQVFKGIGIGAMAMADQFSKLAEALRGPEEPMPRVGDYVRINIDLDQDCGILAEVDNVIWNQNPGLRDVLIILHPFGGGAKHRRKVDPRHLDILNAMEVIAEASR